MKKEQETLKAKFSKLYLSRMTRVGSRFFLLVFVFSTMLFCIPGKKTSNSKVMLLAWLVGEMNSYKEGQVYQNAKHLTGPLGQVEYRGLDFFDNFAFNGIGKYNWQEAGDATFNVGVTLGAMAWRYKNTHDPDTLSLIKRYVNYYKLMQSLNNGGFGRNFVNIEAYDQFLSCNKNGTEGARADNASCGTMRYTDYVFEGQHYKFRYDFSLDAVVHSLVGLYWTYVFVDELKPDIVQICEGLLRYYEAARDYRVRDSRNVELRYGNHNPAVNPVAKINEVILKYIAQGQMTNLGVWREIITLGSSVIGIVVQSEDANFFNHYMLLKGIGVLVHMGYPLQNGLKNLINAVNDQGHELADSMDIYFFQTSKIHVKDKGGFPLYNYHCLVDQTFSDILGLFDRKPYNKWEFSPYRRCVVRQPSALGLNSDFLEAYWLW